MRWIKAGARQVLNKLWRSITQAEYDADESEYECGVSECNGTASAYDGYATNGMAEESGRDEGALMEDATGVWTDIAWTGGWELAKLSNYGTRIRECSG